MSTYCAPCLADLALLREAVTTVSGTAACVAHAVLLLHPGDSAQQRLARLAELRSTAEGKMATASADDVPNLELLVQEYALAGAMDMTVPLRDLAGERTPRPAKSRGRGRDRDRNRGERQGGERGERGERGTRPERGESASSGDAEAPVESAAPAESAAPVESAPVESAPPAVEQAPPAAEQAPPAAEPAAPAESAVPSEAPASS